jgi:hypothetical protein
MNAVDARHGLLTSALGAVAAGAFLFEHAFALGRREPMSNPEALQLAYFYAQDSQRLIAAGKMQRWEVLKWAVTVNLALATAGAVSRSSGWTLFGFFLFCVLVSAISAYLLNHYNRRITGARETLDKILDRLILEYPEIEKFTGKERYPTEPDKLRNYDKEELIPFNMIITFSIVPAFVVWAFKSFP